MGNEDALESRPPTTEDLIYLCRELNRLGARYVVIGGMAVNQHGLVRATEDIDLLIDASFENQAKVKAALLSLPDKAATGIEVGDLERYAVIRVADAFVVDLMKEACGVTYEEAAEEIIFFDLRGVAIPMPSAELLLRLKQTVRAKDVLDREFLERKLKRQREVDGT
ncbi:MAG: hypothetical protein KGZ60_06495 [Truepera sp.]|nr:hypothetical protein [Truepera sp.]